MVYEWLKIIHVLSASVLFGTGLGTAFYMFYVNLQKDVALIARATQQVVLADWLFTGTSGVVQALTGFSLVGRGGYSFTDFWVWGSVVGYLIAGACWLPVVYLQIRCRDLALQAMRDQTPLPIIYYRCYKLWLMLGVPAFLSLVVVFFLMTNRPVW